MTTGPAASARSPPAGALRGAISLSGVVLAYRYLTTSPPPFNSTARATPCRSRHQSGTPTARTRRRRGRPLPGDSRSVWAHSPWFGVHRVGGGVLRIPSNLPVVTAAPSLAPRWVAVKSQTRSGPQTNDADGDAVSTRLRQ